MRRWPTSVVERDATGSIVVSGTVPDRMTAELALANARALGGPLLAADGKVIDRLQTATTSQVDVKLYVLEIDDTGLKNLGVQLQAATYQPVTAGSAPTFTLGQPIFPVVESSGGIGKALTLGSFFRTTTLAPTLNLIITSGHGRILSSPNLVTLPRKKSGLLGRRPDSDSGFVGPATSIDRVQRVRRAPYRDADDPR